MSKNGKRILKLIKSLIMKRLLKYSVETDISKEKFDSCISVIDEE